MKLMVALFAVLLAIGIAFADETSPANWDKDLGSFGNNLREKTTGHSHDYVDNDTIYQDNDVTPDYEVGVGLDLVVYEAVPERTGAKKLIPDAVTVENKYDFANENGSVYVVAKYNLWELLKKKPKTEKTE